MSHLESNREKFFIPRCSPPPQASKTRRVPGNLQIWTMLPGSVGSYLQRRAFQVSEPRQSSLSARGVPAASITAVMKSGPGQGFQPNSLGLRQDRQRCVREAPPLFILPPALAQSPIQVQAQGLKKGSGKTRCPLNINWLLFTLASLSITLGSAYVCGLVSQLSGTSEHVGFAGILLVFGLFAFRILLNWRSSPLCGWPLSCWNL